MGDFEGIQVLLSSWLIRALQKLDPQICMYIYIYMQLLAFMKLEPQNVRP